MNKIHKGVLCLITLAAIAAVRFFSHSLGLYQGVISEMPEELRSIGTFNDYSMFTQDQNNSRLFRFEKSVKGNNAEAYLRFRIPKFDPSGYTLMLKIRARPFVLKHLVVRSAREIMMKAVGEIDGDVATFTINMSPTDTFLWNDGSCYVGLCPDKGSWILTPGDVVELLDFKFSLR